MTDESEKKKNQVEKLIESPNLADALESDQFRHFLDQVPIAIAVSEMKAGERVVYVNPEFERLCRQNAADVEGQAWSALCGESVKEPRRALGTAIAADKDWVGTFRIDIAGEQPAIVDAYSNVIVDEEGKQIYRLAALVDVKRHDPSEGEEIEGRIRDKDTLLHEIQHRVRNNLQMITALIRLEARNRARGMPREPFDRLAGRIESLQLLYQTLPEQGQQGEVDLGVYLTQIASAVMRAHAVEGIRLDLKVDTYHVSADVAMPTGLVVNELLTNALKHAFVGSDQGTITLHSIVDGEGCQIVVADDGVGMPSEYEWPARGKLGALIVRSLRENARAHVVMESAPGRGTRATITFRRADAAP